MAATTPSLLERLIGAIRGRDPQVLVLVSTERGPVAVPVPVSRLRR